MSVIFVLLLRKNVMGVTYFLELSSSWVSDSLAWDRLPKEVPVSELGAPKAFTTPESTHCTSSIAVESSSLCFSSSFVETIHQESAITTRAKPFDPAYEIVFQSAMSACSGGVLSNDSPSRQDGCILTHHCSHATPNSVGFSMLGQSPEGFLRFIHQCTSFGREAVVNLWNKGIT